MSKNSHFAETLTPLCTKAEASLSKGGVRSFSDLTNYSHIHRGPAGLSFPWYVGTGGVPVWVERQSKPRALREAYLIFGLDGIPVWGLV